MLKRIGAALAAVVLEAFWVLGAQPARAADAGPPPLEAYGRLPSISHVDLSPDGARLAIVTRDDQHQQLQVRDVAKFGLLMIAEIGAAKVRSVEWAGRDHLLITSSTAAEVLGLSGPKSEYLMVSDVDLVKKRTRPLMPTRERALNTVVAYPTVLQLKGKPVVFLQGVSFPNSRGVVTLYRADLDSQSFSEVAVGDESTQNWLVDAQGRAMARSQYDERSGRWRVLVDTHNNWTERHVEIAKIEHPALEGFARDGKGLLVSAFDGEEYRLHEVSPEGAWSDALSVDADAPVFDPVSRALLGGMRVKETGTEYVFFSPRDQKVWQAVAKAFKGEELTLASWSDDRAKLVVKVAGAEHGYAYYLVDLSTGSAGWIGDVYAKIGPQHIAEVRLIHYAAADGLDIPAYLTLPKGRPAKALPLIVLAHGGPASRDQPGFDWWAQALASRGYAVLQPQFRGSEGFGRAHLAAGFGEWGRKMQTDLSDGVRALDKQGVIDPKRVCIVGGSYGGYAALAGVTLDKGVYRCAVSVAGLSNLRGLLSYEQEVAGGRNNATLRYWTRFMGVATPSDPKLDAISPARLADRVEAPVLLIHGRDDTVAPFGQSSEMERALKRAGKPVELVALRGEDHWLSRSDTRLQMLDATVRFLETHNPPR